MKSARHCKTVCLRECVRWAPESSSACLDWEYEASWAAFTTTARAMVGMQPCNNRVVISSVIKNTQRDSIKLLNQQTDVNAPQTTSGVFSVGNEPARVEVEGCQRPSEHAVAPIYSFSFLSSLIQQNSWDQSQFRFQHLNPHFITNTHQEIWFKNQLTFVIDITAVAHKLLQRMKGQVSNFVNHVVRISWMKLSDSCKQNLFKWKV